MSWEQTTKSKWWAAVLFVRAVAGRLKNDCQRAKGRDARMRMLDNALHYARKWLRSRETAVHGTCSIKGYEIEYVTKV